MDNPRIRKRMVYARVQWMAPIRKNTAFNLFLRCSVVVGVEKQGDAADDLVDRIENDRDSFHKCVRAGLRM